MYPSPRSGHRHAARQAGFALSSLAIALLLTTLLSVLAAHALAQRLDDQAAQSTGRYLAAVRGALIHWQIRHEAWLAGEDLSTAPAGTYPSPPELPWHPHASGVELLHGGIDDLIADAVLPAAYPRHMPLGERAAFLVARHGPCPGASCRLDAYVYSCHPISRQRSSRASLPCASPTGTRAQYQPALLGQVLLAADGYGGHDAGPDDHFRGPLLHANRPWFPLSAARGHAVLTANLDATPFGQFVRHGDHRPVTLRDRLRVAGSLQTDTGLMLAPPVVPGSACPAEALHQRSGSGHLTICRAGRWAMLHGHAVHTVRTGLRHGDAIPAPDCPAPSRGFQHIALEASDATVSGPALNIHGAIGGSLSGTGEVNATGQVQLSGQFTGAFLADPASSVRTGQTAAITSDGRITITPDGPHARATVIQGCTTA